MKPLLAVKAMLNNSTAPPILHDHVPFPLAGQRRQFLKSNQVSQLLPAPNGPPAHLSSSIPFSSKSFKSSSGTSDWPGEPCCGPFESPPAGLSCLQPDCPLGPPCGVPPGTLSDPSCRPPSSPASLGDEPLEASVDDSSGPLPEPSGRSPSSLFPLDGPSFGVSGP